MIVKELLYTITLLLLSTSSFASHWQAGQINVKHIGGNNYKISMPVLRDCAGITLPNTMNISLSTGSTIVLTKQYSSDSLGINSSCSSYITNSTCNGGSLPGSEYIYYTTTLHSPKAVL